MMRFEPHEEDPNVNIVLRSGIEIGNDKGMVGPSIAATMLQLLRLPSLLLSTW